MAKSMCTPDHRTLMGLLNIPYPTMGINMASVPLCLHSLISTLLGMFLLDFGTYLWGFVLIQSQAH